MKLFSNFPIAESLARLNGQRVQCPVGMSTLNFRHERLTDAKQPYVYLKCGHVFGKVDWGDIEGELAVFVANNDYGLLRFLCALEN